MRFDYNKYYFLSFLVKSTFQINYCIEEASIPGKFTVSTATLKLSDLMISLTKHHNNYYKTGLSSINKQLTTEFRCFQCCFQAYCFHPLHLVYIRPSECAERFDCLKRFIELRDGGAEETADGFIDFGCTHTPYCHLGGPFKDLSNPATKRVGAKTGSDGRHSPFYTV